MINDIEGEKMIDLSYPICSSKEIAVISMLSEKHTISNDKAFKIKIGRWQ